jgi:hypothetical protein
MIAKDKVLSENCPITPNDERPAISLAGYIIGITGF